MEMRRAVLGDYPRLEALAEKEGWNYRLEDFLDLDRTGCATTLVAHLEGAVRGMVTIMDYGDVGWVSNMLVEGGYRGRRIGADLLQEGIRWLGAKRTIALFSYGITAGYYLKQGFKLERDYAVVKYLGGHWGSRGQEEPSFENIVSMDSQAFSTRRGGLLRVLAGKGKIFSPARGKGFALVRPDPVEPIVGPVLCDNALAGEELLYSAFNFLGAGAMGVMIGEAVKGFEVIGRVNRLYVGEPPQTDTGVALAFAGLEFG
jgi:GNAT superfamily N-acetyltransferase